MKIFFVSMGCAKNTVDSERLMGLLASHGHTRTEEPEDAQIGIINTCGFIQDAVKENVDAILDLEQMKEDGTLSHIIVAGCLVNRYERELREELPSVDLFARAEEWDKVAAFIDGLSVSSKDRTNVLNTSCGRAMMSGGTPWSRYLKVGEGCDTFCSYCAIPLIRGRMRSVPVESIVEEAVALCAEGAKELCLVGQDLTAYGRDLYGEPAIRRLIDELDSALPKGTWLRPLYMHPDRMTEDFVDFMAEHGSVLRYFDVPIQHIDDDILAAMNRRTTGEHIKRIFRHIRSVDPYFAIRTTIMTGFPGETDAQFGKVLDFLEEAEIDRVGAFIYSPEEGTRAAEFGGQVEHSIAEARYERLMELQAGISQRRGEKFIGRELDVLVEELDEAGGFCGRSYRDAPEVDGVVWSDSADGAEPGDIVRVRITDCEEHDLFGTRCN